MLLSVIDLKHAPVFDRCVVGCGSENGHQKNMFLEDIGVRVGIVLNSRFNSQHIGGTILYDQLM